MRTLRGIHRGLLTAYGERVGVAVRSSPRAPRGRPMANDCRGRGQCEHQDRARTYGQRTSNHRVVGLTSERAVLDGPSDRDRLCSYRRLDPLRGLRARGSGPYSVGNLYPLRE